MKEKDLKPSNYHNNKYIRLGKSFKVIQKFLAFYEHIF